MKKKVTFADIAAETGFSKTTISRYFNHPDTLTTENLKIIEDTVKKLGYRENKLARVLANGKSEIIGVIVPTLYMHYYADLLSHILSAGDAYSYKFLVFCSDENREKEKGYLKELMAYNIEGLLVVSHVTPSQELAKLGIPVVTIEREDKYVNSVNTNNYQGGIDATTLLTEKKCEVLIHINADLKKCSPAYGRIRGFREVSETSGTPYCEYLRKFGNDYQEIRRVLEPVFQDIEEKYAGRKKGIFISNDTVANVFLNMVITKYKMLPEEYYIIGFDDSPISREAVIPFSTIRQDTTALAYSAMDILVKLMNERKKRVPVITKTLEHRVIDTKTIIRGTTK